MAIVAIELEIPLETMEDLERLAAMPELGLGAGPVDIAERLVIEGVRNLREFVLGEPGPEPRGLVQHFEISPPTT